MKSILEDKRIKIEYEFLSDSVKLKQYCKNSSNNWTPYSTILLPYTIMNKIVMEKGIQDFKKIKNKLKS